MLRKIALVILIFLVLSAALTALVQSGLNRPLAVIKNLNLGQSARPAYERLVFGVNFFGFLPIGYAELSDLGIENYQGKKVRHLSAQAKMIKIVSRFFEVKARADSYIDTENLHSLKFAEVLLIPDKPKDEKEVFYDQDNNIMNIEGVERVILPHTQDPLSAMFYMRQQPLEIGKEFDININTNQKNYRLYIKVLAKEAYSLNGAEVGVWVMRGDIRRRDKSPYHSSEMMLWLLDDLAKTPILVKASASGASITARLVQVQ